MTAAMKLAWLAIDPSWPFGRWTPPRRFSPVRKLGGGGFGVVYLVKDIHLGREVALKLLHPEFLRDRKAAARFRFEARQMACLRNANILTVFDSSGARQRPCFWMEYAAGGSLDARLEKQTALPIAEALWIARQVASGLHAAHRGGDRPCVVHRDVKPANIVFDSDDIAKVSDFGLAKPLVHDCFESADPTVAVSSHLVCTPGFASPEQILAATEPDPRTDIYSLGIVIYRMLTGEMPFKARNSIELLLKTVAEDVPNIRLLVQDAPEPLQLLVARMTARNREQRVQSCQEVCEEIDRVRDSMGLPTPPRIAGARFVRADPHFNLLSFSLEHPIMPQVVASGQQARRLEVERERGNYVDLAGELAAELEGAAESVGESDSTGDDERTDVTLLSPDDFFLEFMKGIREQAGDWEPKQRSLECYYLGVAFSLMERPGEAVECFRLGDLPEVHSDLATACRLLGVVAGEFRQLPRPVTKPSGDGEVYLKIVYQGPGLSGKTVNLEVVREELPSRRLSSLVGLFTEGDRTLAFDHIAVRSLRSTTVPVALGLHSSGGQVFNNATRKAVLRGVDGIVFVADSQRTMIESNVESLANVKENLELQGRSLDQIPLVMQYNKRDLKNICDVEELRTALNPEGRFPEVLSRRLAEPHGYLQTLEIIEAKVLDAHGLLTPRSQA